MKEEMNQLRGNQGRLRPRAGATSRKGGFGWGFCAKAQRKDMMSSKAAILQFVEQAGFIDHATGSKSSPLPMQFVGKVNGYRLIESDDYHQRRTTPKQGR
jgi:hypothetical protein